MKTPFHMEAPNSGSDKVGVANKKQDIVARRSHARQHCFNTRAIDHFPFFFLVYHFFQLGVLYSTVLCYVDLLIVNVLGSGLLPPPSETASMALCAHFLLQAPKP